MKNRFDKHQYFYNRELSWLRFNTRVLREADNEANPLLERLRYLAITANNLDEFFMIRYAGLLQQRESGYSRRDDSGLTVDEQIHHISLAVHKMVRHQYRIWRAILSALAEQGEVRFYEVDRLDSRGQEWLAGHFHEAIFPVITPLAVDAGHPFPFLANKSLNLAVRISDKNGEEKTAVIPVPRGLNRLVRLKTAAGLGYLLLEDIIEHFAGEFFVGYRILEVAAFRITRNSDLSIDEDEADDLLEEVEKSLRMRKRGDAVRLEIERRAGDNLRKFLLDSLELDVAELYEINGVIDLTVYAPFIDSLPLPHMKWSPQPPLDCPQLTEDHDIFAAIRSQDLLLHHPFMSFEPVVDFVRRAAEDPDVLAIKQTLYRVSGDSPIVAALSQAAENGKQVTVLVELKARFDEEKNIRWARRLEQAGCHVIYGLVGLKTHAKMILVVRNESGGIK
ncbi:MAG: polyphosphate kinase 1, partial [Negativicutes bacterium]|nr:polyphosphate kinase 1 [Negativicutes bacterium]